MGFCIKKKFRRKDSQQQKSMAAIDACTILREPFPPLTTRVASPTDLLDVVGYPQQQQQQQPLQQQMNKLTVRNKTPPSISSNRSSRDLPHAAASFASVSLPSLHMPVPKKATVPTRRILDDGHEKTLVLEDVCPQRELLALQQKVQSLQREREDRQRLEWQQQQLEQDMMRAIEHNRAKIDQLSQSIRHAASNPSFRSMTPPMDAPGDHDDDDDQEDYDDNAYPLLFAPMYWQDELSWDDDQGHGHPDSEDDDASIIMDNGQGGMANGGVIMMPASSRYQHHYEPHIPGPRRASVSPRLYAAAALHHMHPSAPPPLHLQARHYAAPSPPTPRSRASSSSYVNRAPPQPFVPPMVYRRSMPPPKTHYSCPSVYDSEFY